VSGPCLCGAPDCIKCFPSNFINGTYIFRECESCGNNYIPEDEDDTVCEECAHIVSGNETDFGIKQEERCKVILTEGTIA